MDAHRSRDGASGSEDAVLARLFTFFPPPHDISRKGGLPEIWIGDDAAVLDPPEGRLLLATDALVAGVHLDMEYATLHEFGWKAVVVNLSDIAAMGGTPHRCVVSVVAPEDTDLDELLGGIAQAAKAFECPVVGGDLSSTTGPLVVSVAVTGYVPPGQAPVLRSGAQPGDAVYVTGPLGASAAGLEELRAGRDRLDWCPQAYLLPVARRREGRAAAHAGATAMIDVSDGFALDLHRLCDASGVGVIVDEVPVAEGVTLEQALGGGEDYELIFTAPGPEAVRRAFSGHDPDRLELAAPIRVGTITDDPAERVFRATPLPRAGWQHRF